VIIVSNADGFALGLGPATGPEPEPGFPHFGFDVDSPEEVRAMRGRLVADGVRLVEEEDADSYVGFKCLDPDAHLVEVAWEPEDR
jgi:catechol 2,3-dioxygenase-like lactoylglutathione lyase family enzyme